MSHRNLEKMLATKQATQERRAGQDLRVVELKLVRNRLSKGQSATLAARNMVRLGLTSLPPEQRGTLVEGMSARDSLVEAGLQFPVKQATSKAGKPGGSGRTATQASQERLGLQPRCSSLRKNFVNSVLNRFLAP